MLASMHVQAMVVAGNYELLQRVHAIGVVIEKFVYTYFLGFLKLVRLLLF
jgi:hypothetical protein